MRKRTLICLVLLAAFYGCSSDEPVGPDGDIDFQGNWVGDIGDPNAVQRIAVAWSPTHSRSTVTGFIFFQLTPALSARGTLSADVDSGFLDLTLTVLPGAFPSPISSSCALSGTGSSTIATNTNIEAMLTLTYTAPCLGTLTAVANVNHRINLTRVE
jgi:hypothetical protein